jgi:hypothetical protein
MGDASEDRKGEHLASVDDLDDADDYEPEDRSHGSLTNTDLAEVDRFVETAYRLLRTGVPWRDAWSIANEVTDSTVRELHPDGITTASAAPMPRPTATLLAPRWAGVEGRVN